MDENLKSGKKVVFTNGVFDLLHEGHLAILKYCNTLGDVLVVGLNSDKSVKMLKGPERPIHDESTRKAALEKTGLVDRVVIFDELRTTEVVKKIRPHVLVKGAEYSIEKVRSEDRVPDHIDIVLAPILTDENNEKISTTNIIKKMKK